MNNLTLTSPDAPLTMSSLEIAELTGKEHRNIIRDIRSMVEALGIGELSFEGSYRSEQNKAMPCFNLPKDLTITLVTGYSIPLSGFRDLVGALQKEGENHSSDVRNDLIDALLENLHCAIGPVRRRPSTGQGNCRQPRSFFKPIRRSPEDLTGPPFSAANLSEGITRFLACRIPRVPRSRFEVSDGAGLVASTGQHAASG